MLDTHARKYVTPVIKGGASFFVGLKLTPNHVTALALIIGVFAGLVAYLEHPIIAVTLLWFSGYLDAVDGEMARMTQQSSPWGTLLDVVFDRVVEGSIIIALAAMSEDKKILLSLLILAISIIIAMT